MTKPTVVLRSLEDALSLGTIRSQLILGVSAYLGYAANMTRFAIKMRG